jgi:Fe-S cluster biosynthesis and repair protein YggX
MIKIINEYRLNLAEAEQYETLLTQMRAFLNIADGVDQNAEVLEVENEKRGRS